MAKFGDNSMTKSTQCHLFVTGVSFNALALDVDIHCQFALGSALALGFVALALDVASTLALDDDIHCQFACAAPLALYIRIGAGCSC